MDVLIKSLQLILSLSILVIIHEFGHFFFARLFDTRVEKFYLFFNPWFSLFKFKKGETEYGIGWLPLGGYVKISGMIDESMDKEQMKEAPKPYEFRSKPAWQRLLIMLGGVMVNFLAAIFIFWMILFKWGEIEIPATNAKYGFYYHPIAYELGLKDGDRILKIDSKEVEKIEDVPFGILLDLASEMTVQRGDSIFTLHIPSDFNQKYLANSVRRFMDFQIPVIVDSVLPETPAHNYGLKKNDSIIAVNNQETLYFQQFSTVLDANKDTVITLSLYRNNELIELPIKTGEDGKLGFAPKSVGAHLGYKHISYNFFQAFPAGIDKGVNLLSGYVRQIKLVFSREGVKQLGGFATIGSFFPARWNWENFWYTTALLSIILAFMNVLPIPALDGGHVLFLLYELIARRKPSDKFMEHAQLIGMALILSLVLYANGNDIYRWLFN